MSTDASRPLLATLRAEWGTRWAGQLLLLPTLGDDTASGWLARIRGCAGPEQDELLVAVLAATADGQQAAERLLLQLLIPPVDRAAAALGLLDDQNPMDRPGLVVAAVWEAIRCTRPPMVRKHIYLTLRRAATACLGAQLPKGQRQLERVTEPVDPAMLIGLAGAQPDPSVPVELRLTRLLDAAVLSRIVTTEEVDLLRRLYLSKRTAAAAAVGMGVSQATLRRRAHRIVERLRRAVVAGAL